MKCAEIENNKVINIYYTTDITELFDKTVIPALECTSIGDELINGNLPIYEIKEDVPKEPEVGPPS